MIAFIDANAWLYLTNPRAVPHRKVKNALDPYLRGEKRFAVSWQIFYEFIRTATDPRVYATPASWSEAFQCISKIFQHAGAAILQEGPDHPAALKFVLEKAGYKQGHFIHDCHIAALLYENGISTIITADQDFRRFPFLTVVDPTHTVQ
ncbi:MAG: PIN domain-containing protein [Deltaproteobacteria bacterium]|nr:PIN domain-containing protein [Deltaproteobacteria bacterium]